ncbi:hypothetical protein OG21DRAFT_1525048, partial [Imleria badia]
SAWATLQDRGVESQTKLGYRKVDHEESNGRGYKSNRALENGVFDVYCKFFICNARDLHSWLVNRHRLTTLEQTALKKGLLLQFDIHQRRALLCLILGTSISTMLVIAFKMQATLLLLLRVSIPRFMASEVLEDSVVNLKDSMLEVVSNGHCQCFTTGS